MATIVTRAGKGTPLTNADADNNFINLNTDKLEAGDALGTPASVTLTNATGLPTAGLVDNAVTDPKLRDSAGLSVMGRGANSTGDPADIVAGTNKQVLRREGSDLAFGAVDLASNQAVTGTLPVNQGGTGITSFGSGVATFLGTPSSANLAAALTDETGTGAAVFATNATLVNPALGTPASGVATNLTGTASGLTAGNVTTNANLTGAVTSTGNATVLGSFSSANLAGALTDETGTGAAVFGTNPVIDGVTVPARTNPLAQAVRVAMTAAASGGGIQVLDDPDITFGTNNFTLHWEGALPDYTPADTVRLFVKNQDSSNRYDMRFNTNGTLLLIAVAGGVTIFQVTSTVITGLTDGSYAKISATVIRETASTDGAVTFYVNGVQLGAAVSITAAATTDISNTGILAINGFSVGSRFASNLNQAIIYNRALAAAEVLSLCVNGVDPADVGASQVAVYESDFSAGVDGIIGLNSTVLGNVDSIGGENDWLKVTATATSSVRTLKSGVVPLDKLVLVTMQVFVPSTNVSCDGVLIRRGGASIERFTGALDTIVNIQSIFPAGVGTSLDLQVVQASGATVVVSVGDEVYIKNVITKQIGATLNLSAQDAQSNTGQIFDTSGNNNHALLPAAGATIIGRPTAQPQQVRWTNTWDGTHELQYIGGVNQAILPANAYIESIVGTVSGATPHDIIIGDGSDTDRYVTITTDLAAGTTTFTLASRVTDGTNLKLTVDPDTDSTMSIAWTITYRTLE